MKVITCITIGASLLCGCADVPPAANNAKPSPPVAAASPERQTLNRLAAERSKELKSIGWVDPTPIDINSPPSLRKAYIDDHPNLSRAIQRAILDGRIIVGMNSEEVLAAWQTDSWTLVDHTDVGDTSISDWKLGDTYVTFMGGTVYSVTYIPQ